MKRHECTKDDPYKEGVHPIAIHPDAIQDCEYDSDYYEKYKCPNCGLEFKVELPSH